MHPTLQEGAFVLVRPTTHADVGDVVVCRHPFRPDVLIIKRVSQANEEGMVLAGDNPTASTDSSSFGVVPWVHLTGVVTTQMPST